MAVYKPREFKKLEDFKLKRPATSTKTREQFAEESYYKHDLQNDTAYSGSQRAKQEKAYETRKLKMPSIQQLRDNSNLEEPNYLPLEEVRANNRAIHAEGREPMKKVGEEKARLAMPTVTKGQNPVKAPKATLSGKINDQQTVVQDNSKAIMTDRIDSNNKGTNKTLRGLKDLPRNLGAGIINALDTGAELLTFGIHNDDVKPRSEEDWAKSDSPFKTYDEYLANLEQYNKGIQEQAGTVERTASDVNEDTSFVEKALRGAALSLPSSLMTAALGGMGAGVAQGLVANKAVIEAVRMAPLFGSGLNGGLQQADEMGLTGIKKATYGITSGLIETVTERMNMLGFEGKLMGVAGQGGFKAVLKDAINEPLTEALNSVAQQTLSGAYTSFEDFEYDLEEIALSATSALIMSGMNMSGEMLNGVRYRTVGVENGKVLIQTDDGRVEAVAPEVVAKHNLERTKPEYDNVKRMTMEAETQSIREEVQTEPTMPTQEPTRSQEPIYTETEVSTQEETKPLTEPLNERWEEDMKAVKEEYGADGSESYSTESDAIGVEYDEQGRPIKTNEEQQSSVRNAEKWLKTIEAMHGKDSEIAKRVREQMVRELKDEGIVFDEDARNPKSIPPPETVSVNEIDKVIGKPKGKKNVDYLEYYEVVKNFPEYAFKADDDFIDIVEGMEIQAKKAIEESIGGKDAFKAKLKNGQYIIAHPSTKNGEVQVSFFDDKGAIMDEQMKRSELVDRLIEARVLPKDITDEGAATQKEPQIYTYTFRTRGLSPGAQPKGFVSDNPSEGKFGSISYDRPLTEKEIRDYELVPVNKPIPPPETELQANEERLSNMIEKGLIDTKRKRDMAKSLNQKIVEQGGQDRIQEIEPKKVEVPKPKQDAELAKKIQRQTESEAFEKAMKKMGYKTLNDLSEQGLNAPKQINIKGMLKPEMYMNQRLQLEALQKIYEDNLRKDKKFIESITKQYNDEISRNERTRLIEESFSKEDWEVPRDIFIERGSEYIGGKYAGDIHKEAVEKALKEGKSVPEDVLSSYEDTDLISSDDNLISNNMAMEGELGGPRPELKERYTRQTLLQSDKVQEQTKTEIIEPDPALYQPKTNDSVNYAVEIDVMAKGYDNYVAEFFDRAKNGDSFQSDYDQSALQLLLIETEARMNGKDGDARLKGRYQKLLQMYYESGTEAGRTLQIRKQMAKTPVAKALEAKREVESTWTKEQKKTMEEVDTLLEDFADEDALFEAEDAQNFVDKIDGEFSVRESWLEKLKKDIEQGNVTVQDVREQLAQELNIPVLTQEEFDRLKSLMEEKDSLDPESPDYKKKEKDILTKTREIVEAKKITVWQKVSTVQTMAMLMNVKTTLRNEIGNFLGYTTGQFDDVFSYFFDLTLSNFTGQRASLNPALNPAKYKYIDGVKASLEQYSNNVVNEKDGKYIKKKVFTPGSKMGKLERVLTVMLSDLRHKEPRIKMIMEQIDATALAAEKAGKKFDAEEMKANVNFLADYYTFNFDSALGKWLDDTVKNINRNTFFKDEAFGVGTIFAKFAKTPMNLIQFQLDHIGADLLREGARTAKLAKTYGFENAVKRNQLRIARSLGKTSTGLTFIALGALLQSAGAFTPEEEDKDKKNVNESQGVMGGYLNLSALRRAIGGDANSGYQSGDTTISINWMLPVAPFMLLGARISAAKSTKEKEGITDLFSATVKAGGESLSDFAELPFNRTLGILMNSYDTWGEKGIKVASGVVTGFIPSLLKQFTQGTDPRAKRYSKNAAEAFGEQILVTVPGLSKKVPARFDVTGETNKYTDNEDMALDILEMMTNPAYRSTIEEDKDLGKAIELYDKGKLPSLPKLTNDYFSYNGTKYEMTREEHQEYQKDYWEAYKSRYTRKNDGKYINAHDYALEQAKIKYLKSKKVKVKLTESGRLK